jgi:hypothetical protein
MKEHIESANRLVAQYSESRVNQLERDQIQRVREGLVDALGNLIGHPVKIVAFPLNERHQIGRDSNNGKPQYVTIPAWTIHDGPRGASVYPRAVITETGNGKIFIEPKPSRLVRESEPVGYDVAVENIISIAEAEQPETLKELSS